MDIKTCEKVLHIMYMALMIGKTGNQSVNIMYISHSNALRVKVYEKGWSWSYGHPKPEPSFDVTAVLDINCKNELDTAIEYLEALSKKNGINVAL